MSENSRRFMLNRKSLAALKAAGENKWAYAHISKAGVTCTDGLFMIARVSLPKTLVSVPEAQIISLGDAETFKKTIKDDECISIIPELLLHEPKTGPRFTVPALDKAIPETSKAAISVTVDAKQLITMLKMACEVTEHARSLVKLRICGNGIRIDSHRVEGEQEFVGHLKTFNYKGPGFAGEATENSSAGVNVSEAVEQKTLSLPNVVGRRFR